MNKLVDMHTTDRIKKNEQSCLKLTINSNKINHNLN